MIDDYELIDKDFDEFLRRGREEYGMGEYDRKDEEIGLSELA